MSGSGEREPDRNELEAAELNFSVRRGETLITITAPDGRVTEHLLRFEGWSSAEPLVVEP